MENVLAGSSSLARRSVLFMCQLTAESYRGNIADYSVICSEPQEQVIHHTLAVDCERSWTASTKALFGVSTASPPAASPRVSLYPPILDLADV